MATVAELNRKFKKAGFKADVVYESIIVSRLDASESVSDSFGFEVSFDTLPGTCTAEEMMTSEYWGPPLSKCPLRKEAIELLAKKLNIQSDKKGILITNALAGSDLELLAKASGMKKVKSYKGQEGTINTYVK